MSRSIAYNRLSRSRGIGWVAFVPRRIPQQMRQPCLPPRTGLTSAQLSSSMLVKSKGTELCLLDRPIHFSPPRQSPWHPAPYRPTFSSWDLANRCSSQTRHRRWLISNLAPIPPSRPQPGTRLLPNSRILLRCGPLVSHCAAILGSGSGSVMFTRGDGSST